MTPMDQSSSSIESPHGPFLLLPLNSALENGVDVLPGIACGKYKKNGLSL